MQHYCWVYPHCSLCHFIWKPSESQCMYYMCVCVCVCISTLKQGQLCLTAEHCLQLLSCQSFFHDMSHNTFWKLLIFRDWVQTKFLRFFCYCCCPVIYPVSAEQGYILNCCHVEGREWSCQSCTARLCVFQTNPVLLLCHNKANWVALMLCEPGGLCIVVSWWQEDQVRRNCSRPVWTELPTPSSDDSLLQRACLPFLWEIPG